MDLGKAVLINHFPHDFAGDQLQIIALQGIFFRIDALDQLKELRPRNPPVFIKGRKDGKHDGTQQGVARTRPGNAADGIFKEDHPVIAAELERVAGDQQQCSADQPDGQPLNRGRPEQDHQDGEQQPQFQLQIAERQEKQDQHEAKTDPPVADQVAEPGGHASGQIEGVLFN